MINISFFDRFQDRHRKKHSVYWGRWSRGLKMICLSVIYQSKISKSIRCREDPKTVLEPRDQARQKHCYEEPHQMPLTVFFDQKKLWKYILLYKIYVGEKSWFRDPPPKSPKTIRVTEITFYCRKVRSNVFAIFIVRYTSNIFVGAMTLNLYLFLQ